MRRSVHDQRGQTAVEYAGLLVVIAVIFSAVASSGLGAAAGAALGSAICRIAAGAPCTDREAPAVSAPAPAPAVIPAPAAPEDTGDTGGSALDAFVDGFMRGDFNRTGYGDPLQEGARNAGQLASSVLIVGDIRDAAAAVDKLRRSGWRDGWSDLGWSAAGTIPVAGDWLKAGRGVARTADTLDNPVDLIRAGEAYRGLKAAGRLADLSPFERRTAEMLGRRGEAILGLGDRGVRQVLRLPKDRAAADFLTLTPGGRFHVKEVKETGAGGSSHIDDSLQQLESTVAGLKAAVRNPKIGRLEIVVPPNAALREFEVSGDQLIRRTDDGPIVERIHGHVVHVLTLE